jgi:hypothetical protein
MDTRGLAPIEPVEAVGFHKHRATGPKGCNTLYRPIPVCCCQQGQSRLFLFSNTTGFREHITAAIRSAEDFGRVQSQIRADGRSWRRSQQSLHLLPDPAHRFPVGPLFQHFQYRVTNGAWRTL